MSTDDPRQPIDGDLQHDRHAGPASRARHAPMEVFEARTDAQGEWRLDESASAGGNWASRLKQFLVVAASLALAAALWVFAFALMLVLLPLVALAGWWMWRRLKSMQRAQMARARGAEPL